MPMLNPCHPGEVLKEALGPDGLKMTVTEAARRLGVSRVALSRVLNGKAAVSPDLAIRLEKAKLSVATLWMDMQVAYDLSQAKKRKQPRVVPFDLEVPKAA